MEFFPFRRTRQQADAVMDQLRAAIDAKGYGFAAVEDGRDRRDASALPDCRR